MKTILMCGPFNTQSGYGHHARSIFWALHNPEKYDIKIIDVRWGDTPRNFLREDNPEHKLLLDAILSNQTLDQQPDIYIDIRISNEFQAYGKVNLGITAGIETNAVSAKWIEGCNKMDLVIVPSEHSKSGFVSAVYDKYRNLPDGKQQRVGELKLEKPVEVVFEGCDDSIYRPLKFDELDSKLKKTINDLISEDFAFLFVGQWTKGGYGEDRKDIGKLIKVFYETFANQKKQPALLLKTSGASLSITDQVDILKKIKNVKQQFPYGWNLPNVYLLHGDLTDEEMNTLYNHPKIKTMVSFTHGEGFGRPLLEAAMVGLPIIASEWSGQVDFLDEENMMYVKGDLQQVPKSAVWKDIIIPESKWFVINEHEAYKALVYAYENAYDIKAKARTMMKQVRGKYTQQKMRELLNEVVDKYTKHIVSAVSLKLPKLKKISDNKPDIPTIQLPKLKKIT